MIINKYGRYVVPIGETFECDGVEYRCETADVSEPLQVSNLIGGFCAHCAFRQMHFICRSLECWSRSRIDNKNVFFVEVEGGEDERK